MFMPSSLQADKAFLMGEKNNMLSPIISDPPPVPGNTNVRLN